MSKSLFFSKVSGVVKEGLSFPLTYFLSFFPYELSWKGTGTPLLLIHGYLNSSLVWFYHGKRFQKNDIGPVYTVFLGKPFLSIREYAKKVQEKAVQIQKETNRNDLILVGHSMGGIVAAYYALKLADKTHVKAVLTMGSPFHGTKVAKIAFGECAHEMAPSSILLKEIEEERRKKPKIPFYCIATSLDHIVVPPSSALMGEDPDREVVLDSCGHSSLLFSREANKKMVDWSSAYKK
jgi:predicted alpha/beta hydrolase family esterase